MSIDWADQSFSPSWLRGYYQSPWSLQETVARIVTASGQLAKSKDGDKTSVNFVGAFNGQRFTLYDYKEDLEIHIGGNDLLDVEGLKSALTRALEVVEPTPYRAKEYYDQCRGHAWSRV